MRPSINTWHSTRLRYAVIAGLLLGAGLLLLWQGDYFMALRLRINDLYYAPLSTKDEIVIIAVDDASLSRYGRTPAEWSRTVYVDLIEVLAESSARVLALDLLFSETEPEDEAFAEALARLRQNEARTRIVLAAAGLHMQSAASASNQGELPFSLILPMSDAIEEHADYLGFTNALPDIDGVIRRQPSFIRIGEKAYPTFSIAAYLAYLRIPRLASEQLILKQDDNLLLPGDRRIPIDSLGFWQPNYFGPPAGEVPGTFQVVSLTDVLDGHVSPAEFDDKIVLVGLMNTTGLLDQYQVPSATRGALMAGVEIQANAIESLLQNIFITNLPGVWQGFVIISLTVFSSLVYALPRWYFKILLALVLCLLAIVVTSLVFSLSYTSVNLFDVLLALSLPLIVSIGIDITLETQQRQQKEFLLSSLQRIAEQHLQIEEAAEHILRDVARIAPNTPVALYIRESAALMSWRRFGQVDPSEPEINSPIQEDLSTVTLKRDASMTAIPLRWQGKQQGMLMFKRDDIDYATQVLLQDFADQLAPNIDNMLLYDEVQRQKMLFDAVFAESPAGIALVDAIGRIVQCNQDLALRLGSSSQLLEGKSLIEFLAAKASNDNLADRLRSGLKLGAKFSVDELELSGAAVRIDIAPLRAYQLWIVVIIDITAIVELSKLKTQMLRMASHDLKNPLARIMGFTELLQTGASQEVQSKRFLDFIANDAKAMLNIVDDLLNIERLRSGKRLREDTNLTVLVQEVCNRHQPDLLQKRQIIELQVPDYPVRALVDAGQLSQAITNLIGNAIKYTPDEGHITVRLMNEDRQIRFEVEDNGYGIPEESQAKVFLEFYRVKSKHTAQISGTGLGLSLVKRVIEEHNGLVGLKSVEGSGSTFYFVIPKVEAHEAAQKT